VAELAEATFPEPEGATVAEIVEDTAFNTQTNSVRIGCFLLSCNSLSICLQI